MKKNIYKRYCVTNELLFFVTAKNEKEAVKMTEKLIIDINTRLTEGTNVCKLETVGIDELDF